MTIRTGTTYLLAALLTGVIGCGSDSNNNGTGGSGGRGGGGAGGRATGGGGNGGNRAGGGNGGTVTTGGGGNGGTVTGGSGGGGNGGNRAGGGNGGNRAGGGNGGNRAGGGNGGNVSTGGGGNGGNRAGGGNGGNVSTGGGGNGGNVTGGGGNQGGAGGAVATLTDPQVAGVVLAANLGEIQEAQLAQSKSTNTAVLNFAAMMITDHNAATTRLQQVLDAQNIMTADSPQRQTLSSMANNTTNMLFTQTGATFDRNYAMSQVMAHQTVLNLFDTVLIPSAQNAALKAELQTQRTAVAGHLTMAQQLVAALSSDAGVADGGGGDAH